MKYFIKIFLVLFIFISGCTSIDEITNEFVSSSNISSSVSSSITSSIQVSSIQSSTGATSSISLSVSSVANSTVASSIASSSLSSSEASTSESSSSVSSSESSTSESSSEASTSSESSVVSSSQVSTSLASSEISTSVVSSSVASSDAGSSTESSEASSSAVSSSIMAVIVHFKKPIGWGAPSVYYYDAPGATPVEWDTAPAMLEEGNDWYVYIISGATTAKVIFKDEVNQIPAPMQPGFERTGEGWYYTNNQWYDYNPETGQSSSASTSESSSSVSSSEASSTESSSEASSSETSSVITELKIHMRGWSSTNELYYIHVWDYYSQAYDFQLFYEGEFGAGNHWWTNTLTNYDTNFSFCFFSIKDGVTNWEGPPSVYDRTFNNESNEIYILGGYNTNIYLERQYAIDVYVKTPNWPGVISDLKIWWDGNGGSGWDTVRVSDNPQWDTWHKFIIKVNDLNSSTKYHIQFKQNGTNKGWVVNALSGDWQPANWKSIQTTTGEIYIDMSYPVNWNGDLFELEDTAISYTMPGGSSSSSASSEASSSVSSSEASSSVSSSEASSSEASSSEASSSVSSSEESSSESSSETSSSEASSEITELKIHVREWQISDTLFIHVWDYYSQVYDFQLFYEGEFGAGNHWWTNTLTNYDTNFSFCFFSIKDGITNWETGLDRTFNNESNEIYILGGYNTNIYLERQYAIDVYVKTPNWPGVISDLKIWWDGNGGSGWDTVRVSDNPQWNTWHKFIIKVNDLNSSTKYHIQFNQDGITKGWVVNASSGDWQPANWKSIQTSTGRINIDMSNPINWNGNLFELDNNSITTNVF